MKVVGTKVESAGPVEIRRGSFVAKIYRRKRTIRGRDYELATLSYYEPGGKRRVRDFGDMAKAKQAAHEAADAFAVGRPDALSFTAEERQQFDSAQQILSPLGLSVYAAAAELVEAHRKLPPGVTLAEAVADYAKRHPANAPKVPVGEAVAALLADREAAKCSGAYLAKLRSHLTAFAKAFTGPLSSLHGAVVGEWLRGLTDAKGKPVSNRTRWNYAGSITTLFKFAQSRRWVSRDLAEEIAEVPVAKPEAVGEVGTFTPAEIRRLLEAAPDDIRATLAIGAFAGLRTEELHRLEWRDVRLAERVIIVGADKAKTASRRVVPISDNLAAWLAPLWRADGAVDPSPTSKATTHRWRRVGERVGVPWRHNALRHSFISYRVAVAHDPAKVAFEAGNSPAMIHKHYRALVTEAQGREWFAVCPPVGQEAEVLPMEAASRAA